MNKCKECKYRIRMVKISGRSCAIHEYQYCMKKKRYIKPEWFFCGTDCKHFDEKARSEA